jgi:hypothetical protein
LTKGRFLDKIAFRSLHKFALLGRAGSPLELGAFRSSHSQHHPAYNRAGLFRPRLDQKGENADEE